MFRSGNYIHKCVGGFKCEFHHCW